MYRNPQDVFGRQYHSRPVEPWQNTSILTPESCADITAWAWGRVPFEMCLNVWQYVMRDARYSQKTACQASNVMFQTDHW